MAAPDSERLAAFFTCCTRGDDKGLEALRVDAPLLRAQQHGCFGLDLAAARGHTKAMLHLLARGAHVDGLRSRPPLCFAAANGELEAVECLLTNPHRKASVDARDAFGFTALLEAAKEGHSKILVRLLAAGASTRSSGAASGNTALHLAVERNFAAAVTALLAAGADTKAKNALGLCPKVLAMNAGHQGLALLLHRHEKEQAKQVAAARAAGGAGQGEGALSPLSPSRRRPA